ncbi:hypothetical protein BDV38DRAFT_235892, partial [Aspergillus pseudotamarii]
MIDRHWVSSMGLIRSHGTGHQPYRTPRRKALSKRSQRIRVPKLSGALLLDPLSLILSQDPRLAPPSCPCGDVLGFFFFVFFPF